jgi:hypothetical protein
MVEFGISGVEASGSATSDLVKAYRFIIRFIHWLSPIYLLINRTNERIAV